NEPHEKRFDWIPGDIKLNENAETVYFVGCSTSYRIQKNAITTMRILNAAGVDFKVLGSEEFCCGSPVIRTGDKKSFIDILNVNMDKIEAMGIKTMLFSCAGCYDTFKVEYPIYRKFDVTLLSTIEFFERLIDDGRIKLVKDVPLTVTYHDPCHLGRNNELYEEWDGDTVPMIPLVSMNVPPKPKRCGSHGVYDAPRNILEKIPGLKLVEMERIREYSYCCGAGGGVKAAFPEFALNTAETRLEEAEDTGAETLVSDCPFCEMNLKDGIKARDSSLKYYDISEILAMAMGIIDATKNGGVSD
ncbi:MAG: (Fe-S)-binding protein, partial [Candidatus Hodarchaeota archaeon]